MESKCSGLHSNITNETNVPLHLVYNPNEWIVFIIVWPTMVVFGLLTNLTFIFVIFRAPSLRTPTFIYLVNLSVSDLILSLQLSFKHISDYATSPIRFDYSSVGQIGCLVLSYINGMAFSASIAFVSMVSLERYLAICHPIYHHLVKGKKRTAKFISGVWLYANLLAIWIVFYSNNITHECIAWPADIKYSNYPIKVARCSPQSVQIGSAVLGSIMAGLSLFTICNAFMYFKIMKTVRVRERNPLGCSVSPETAQSHQVATMLVANGTVFFICCMLMVVNMILYALRSNDLLKWNDLFQVVNVHCVDLVLSVNSSINPIVYGLTNKRYRDTFFNVMKGLVSWKQDFPSSVYEDNWNTTKM